MRSGHVRMPGEIIVFTSISSNAVLFSQIFVFCGQVRIEAMSTVAVAARRALQQQRARFLYRKTLRNVLSWAVHREIFYEEAQKVREKFEFNRDVTNLETIDRLLYEGETKNNKFLHPDPYIVPWAPGGSKWARNPPVPEEIGLVMDFGREEDH